MNKKDNKEFNLWLKTHKNDSGKKIQDSAIFTGILTKNFLESPLCAFQMGYAILMDKPIIIVADMDTQIPLSLTKIAKVIERVDLDDPESQERVRESISRFMKTFSNEESNAPAIPG